MEAKDYNLEGIDIAWCPGCGDFGILNALKQALAELAIAPGQLAMVSGIGQAAKIPHYLKCNFFNGLHGRALPAATAIKAANPGLTVIAESGDGDMYGEGGNHFLHALRRNPNITNIVHDNRVYGLTKGQASPTSPEGFVTPVQVDGVVSQPFNPMAAAIAMDASFVARAFSGDIAQTKEIIKKAILHPGYALVDIFQPCVSFNKVNTHQWFKAHTYYLDASYDPRDRQAAFNKALETEQLPLGILYVNPARKPFEESLSAYRDSRQPLFQRRPDLQKLARFIEERRH